MAIKKLIANEITPENQRAIATGVMSLRIPSTDLAALRQAQDAALRAENERLRRVLGALVSGLDGLRGESWILRVHLDRLAALDEARGLVGGDL